MGLRHSHTALVNRQIQILILLVSRQIERSFNRFFWKSDELFASHRSDQTSIRRAREKGAAAAPPARDQRTVRSHRWWTAADNTEVRLYEIRDGDHDRPRYLGNTDRTTADVIWDFLKTHLPTKR